MAPGDWMGARTPHDRFALGWQIALAVYMQLITWLPLGRWNYQPCCPTGLEQWRRGTLTGSEALTSLAFLLPAAIFWLGARRQWRWVMFLALVPLGIWLALQLWTWWPPYIVGASERWAQVYARAFAQSTPLLPRWGNHLPPDASHFVLQVLLVGALASGTMVVRRPASAR